MKLSDQNLKLTLAVTLAILGGANSVHQVQAESAVKPVPREYRLSVDEGAIPDAQKTFSDDSNRLIFLQLEAAKKGYPGRREGGGHYGGGNECKSVNIPLTALVPGEEKEKYSSSIGVQGLTASGYPSFWFYIPYEAKIEAEFVLVNNTHEHIYQEKYQLTGVPGIVRIPLLSTSITPLEIDKDYQWTFSIICNPQDRSEDIYVQGWVKRVSISPNLIKKLQTATPQEKVFLYAKEGLWYETVTTLVEELRPNNFQKATLLMNSLLQDVGLNDIARQPIIECCTGRRQGKRI